MVIDGVVSIVGVDLHGFHYPLGWGVDELSKSTRVAVVAFSEFTSWVFLKNYIGGISMEGVIFCPKSCGSGVRHEEGGVEFKHFGVRSGEPREVVMVIGVVDRHRFVILVARRVA